MLLREYLGQYLLSRDTCEKYRKALGFTIDGYGQFLRHAPAVGDLSDAQVNGYLAAVDAAGHSRWTVRGERQRLLALWNGAFDDGLLAMPPRRVRKIAIPESVVHAWGEAELRKLLDACDTLRGRFKNRWRIARRDYGRALVMLAYDTGARLGDLERFALADIASDGTIWWVQSKSGKEQGATLWPETIEAVRIIAHPERRAIFGGTLDRNYFYLWARGLIGSAGLTGTFRWIRRSSGSLVERDNPGWGHKQLGNRPEVFRKHYDCKRITQAVENRPRPPRIA